MRIIGDTSEAIGKNIRAGDGKKETILLAIETSQRGVSGIKSILYTIFRCVITLGSC